MKIIKIMLFSALIGNCFAVRDDVRRLFDSGDYNGVRNVLVAQGNLINTADDGDKFYLIASTSPYESFSQDLDPILAGMDLTQVVNVIDGNSTAAERLLYFMSAHGNPNERDQMTINVVCGLLNLHVSDNTHQATPQHFNRDRGLIFINEAAQHNCRHAQYWLGHFYTVPNSPTGLNILKAIQCFTDARVHIKAIQRLRDMGISIESLVLSAEETSPVFIGKNTREKFRDEIIIPAYEKDLKNFTAQRRGCLCWSNVLELSSVVFAGTSTAFAYGATQGDSRLALVAGVLGTCGLVLKGFAHFTSGEAKENSQQLNMILKDLKLNPMPILSNGSGDSV